MVQQLGYLQQPDEQRQACQEPDEEASQTEKSPSLRAHFVHFRISSPIEHVPKVIFILNDVRHCLTRAFDSMMFTQGESRKESS